MTKFKVGDKVDRVQGLRSFQKLEGGGPYTVTAVSPSARFIQINLNNHYGDSYPWDAQNFKLVEQDDPLPPAPKSGVYYSHNNDRRLTVLLEEGLPEDVIAVGTGASFLKVRLTAETALVLAHDLNRMAMEIKRKEKQNAHSQY